MFGTFNLYQVSLKTTENVKTKKRRRENEKVVWKLLLSLGLFVVFPPCELKVFV